MNPFEFIYRWFVSLFGDNLADYLAGWDCTEEAYINQNLYIPIGFVALGISIVIMVIYYYIIGNLPIGSKLNKWWHWVLVLLFVAGINLFIGYGWTLNEMPNIGDCLMYVKDDKGNIINTLITDVNCWMFGLANSFVSSIFFIAVTFIGKWGSTNCRRTPFF